MGFKRPLVRIQSLGPKRTDRLCGRSFLHLQWGFEPAAVRREAPSNPAASSSSAPGGAARFESSHSDQKTTDFPAKSVIFCTFWTTLKRPSNSRSRNRSTIPREPTKLTYKIKRFFERTGLPDMSPHDLRHSCASLLLANGADIKSVQEIMGHADAGTTLNYYVASNLEQARAAVDRMADAFGI